MEPTNADTTPEPDWIRQGIRSALGELREFFVTGYAFARQPGRFAREWASGGRHALNPAAMVATAASLRFVLTLAQTAIGGDAGAEKAEGFAKELVDAFGPHLHYATLGLIAHGLLRLSGPTRRVSSSIAMAMIAGAGPAFFAESLLRPLLAAFPLHAGAIVEGALLAGACATMAAFAWTVGAALAGLHERRRSWALVAVGMAFVVTGILFGALPNGMYGLHLKIGIEPRPLRLSLDVLM
ncbi:MAG TPA: hypothetical protein VGI39_20510 [Polyangiaceae bacterium]|jgi:hypothetical protein